ncbi:hypothetical protein ACFQX6_27580 [Streptosporangium lutulentum]
MTDDLVAERGDEGHRWQGRVRGAERVHEVGNPWISFEGTRVKSANVLMVTDRLPPDQQFGGTGGFS